MATSGFERDAKQEELRPISLVHLIEYAERITRKIKDELSLRGDISLITNEFTYIKTATEHFEKLVESSISNAETGLAEVKNVRDESPLDGFDDTTTLLEGDDPKIITEYKIVQQLVHIRNWILVQRNKLLDAEKFVKAEYENIVIPDYTEVTCRPEFDKIKNGNAEQAKKLKDLDAEYDRLKTAYLTLIKNFHLEIENFMQLDLMCPPFNADYEKNLSDRDNLQNLLSWATSVLTVLPNPKRLSPPKQAEVQAAIFKDQADKLIVQMGKVKSDMEALFKPQASHIAVKERMTSKAHRTLGAEQKATGELVSIDEKKSAPKKGHHIVCYVFEAKKTNLGHVALWDGENYYSYGDPHYSVKKMLFGRSEKEDKNIQWKKFGIPEDEADLVANQETNTYGNYKKFTIPVDTVFLKKRPLFQNEFLTENEAKAFAEAAPNANFPNAGKWSTTNYNIKSQNCVHMVRSYLELAGCEVYNRALFAETPTDFGIELTNYLIMKKKVDDLIQKAQNLEKAGVEKFIAGLASDPLKKEKEEHYKDVQRNFKRSYLILVFQASAQKTSLQNLQSDLQQMITCKPEDIEANYWNVAARIGIKLFASQGDPWLKNLFHFMTQPLHEDNYVNLTKFVFPKIDMTATRVRSKTVTSDKTAEPAPSFLNRRETVAAPQQPAADPSKKSNAPR